MAEKFSRFMQLMFSFILSLMLLGSGSVFYVDGSGLGGIGSGVLGLLGFERT